MRTMIMFSVTQSGVPRTLRTRKPSRATGVLALEGAGA
jgi:hypothetical protein